MRMSPRYHYNMNNNEWKKSLSVRNNAQNSCSFCCFPFTTHIHTVEQMERKGRNMNVHAVIRHVNCESYSSKKQVKITSQQYGE